MKNLKFFALLPLLMMGTSAFANHTMTFAGNCKFNLEGKGLTRIGSFNLEAQDDECPHQNFEFTVTDKGNTTTYGIYVEFQRGEFGPGLTDKPFIGVYEKNEGSFKNHVRAFNVKQGTVLDFEHALKDGARLICTGTIH